MLLSLAGGLTAISVASYGLLPTIIEKNTLYKGGECNEKVLYLTFDDGPSKEYTSDLLDLLKKHNIKATFFVVGAFAERCPEIIKRMKSEGHTIGIHSYAHRSGLLQTPWYTKNDFKLTIEIMKKLGVSAKFYRPPWGHMNLAILKNIKKYNLEKVLWQVMAEDWEENTTSDIIVKKLIDRTKSGDIICLHDGRGKNHAPNKMIVALGEVIPIWLSDGYRFESVEEMCE